MRKCFGHVTAGVAVLILSVVLLSYPSAGPRVHALDEALGRANITGSATGRRGIVVTEDSLATEAALRVLRDGGNAVDAAVTAAFVLAVTFPEAGNLGGGGFMVVRDPTKHEIWTLDFRETAPAAATPDMYERLAGEGNKDASLVGPLSAAIPGTPAGLHAAWDRAGSLPWAELIEPAIEIAREGFVIGETLHRSIEEKTADLRRYEATRAIFFRDGRPLARGDRLVQEDLAEALRWIAADGPDAFYNGEIARQLANSVEEAGGLWTLEDLQNYEPVFRDPVRITLREKPLIQAVTMGPPASGWLVIGQGLAFMKSQDALQRRSDDPRRAAALTESFRLGFADRNTKLGDPAHMAVRPDALLNRRYLDERARLLPRKPPGDSRKIAGGTPRAESRHTTHIVVMDDRGGVVSLSTTINARFGSKWIAPGTGILLNNEMDDFDTRPGKPNMYGLVGSGVNAVRPGARMLSSMSPTIVLRNGEVWFALGARGGPRIPTALLQVILYRCFDGVGLAEAVASPRIHHQWWPDKVFVEKDREIPGLRAALEKMGYDVGIDPEDPVIAKVIAAERISAGRFLGVCDPRTGGLAKGW